MKTRTKNILKRLGFSTSLINKITQAHHTVSALKLLSKKALKNNYTSEEIEIISAKIHRTPIYNNILKEILEESNNCCCYCEDGNLSQPYQIHHIVLYSISQDNKNDNLMLVCPIHHSLTHLENQSKESQIFSRNKWIALVRV